MMEVAEEGLTRPWSGKQLDHLLKSLSRAIEIVLEVQQEEPSLKRAKTEKRNCLVKDLKAHLCVGINNVTRALERMPSQSAAIPEGELQPIRSKTVDSAVIGLEKLGGSRDSRIKQLTDLQAVLVAMDVHPRALVGHVALLCANRGIPILPIIGGDGCGSLRLGELLGTRTAIAIGIKEGDTAINWAVQSVVETRAK